jgi:hypothetical protein
MQARENPKLNLEIESLDTGNIDDGSITAAYHSTNVCPHLLLIIDLQMSARNRVPTRMLVQIQRPRMGRMLVSAPHAKSHVGHGVTGKANTSGDCQGIN